MTLRDHLRAALVRWPLVLGLFVLGLLVGTLVALAQPTTWTSSALVGIGPRTTSTSTPSSTTIALQDASIRSTLVQMAMSPSTTSYAVALASAQDLDAKITAVVINDSNVVEIRGTASEPAAAEQLARAATARTSASFERLYPLFVVASVSPAASAKEQKASVLTAAVLGGVAGLFLGYLLALAAEAARRSLAARPAPSTGQEAGPGAGAPPAAGAATDGAAPKPSPPASAPSGNVSARPSPAKQSAKQTSVASRAQAGRDEG
jgi:uncharacterized protein involved in exopolysaccharide biosynthesis